MTGELHVAWNSACGRNRQADVAASGAINCEALPGLGTSCQSAKNRILFLAEAFQVIRTAFVRTYVSRNHCRSKSGVKKGVPCVLL